MYLVVFLFMNCGIYKIWFHDRKLYVGSSVELKRRLIVHKSELKRNIHDNIHLQRAYNKHGESELKTEIIEFCTPEKTIEREQFYIEKYKGSLYNICMTAGNCLGVKHTEETKRKKSDMFKGESNPFYGKKHSEETLKKLSEKLKIINSTNEARLKNSIAHIGLQTGSKNGMSKRITNTVTGEIFESISEAANSIKISRKLLSKQLCGYNKNKTNMKYV